MSSLGRPQSTPDFQSLFEAVPGHYLVLLPDAPRFTIVAATDDYARVTMTTRDEILGRGIFDLFPGDSSDPTSGATRLRKSLERVLSRRVPDPEGEQYDIREPAAFGGTVGKRWWRSRNCPVIGPRGDVQYIIHAIDDVTEPHRLDEERQRFAASLRLANELFNQASDSIFIADMKGRLTDVNASACRMVGDTREHLIGRSILEFLAPEDVPRLADAREYLRSSGMVQVAEWTSVRKDGKRIPVEASAKILPDGRWQAIVRDISERKRIEDELKDANAYLDAIIENIPLMLFIKDSASLRFLRFNRAGEDLLGWPRQRFLGKTDYEFWPREQAEFFVEKDREALKGGKIVDIAEEPIETHHHGVRLLHTKKVPILDRTGQPSLLLGISEDITERRRIEKERQLLADVSVVLSASLDFESTLATVARLLVENVADWCVIDVVEEHGQLRRLKVASADRANAALCQVLERMPPDRDLPHLIRSVVESRRPQVVEHVSLPYVESLAQGPEHLQALLAAGLSSFVVVPLLAGGQSVGAMLLGSSTPSRVFGPGDLPLAKALADRAAMAIVNARLYLASVRASELRDQMLSVVAHDLRSPLSTILLQASALRRRGPEPERRSQKSEDAIHRAVARMNRLIDDLTDIALVESGQLRIQRARLSTRELIAAVVELLRPLAASSRVELRVDVDEDVPELLGDRDRLLQVLENLIGNAIKFTEPGGSIVARASSGDHHEVLFSVADTGPGIAVEHLPHVFERFWQATNTGRHGAGLGLAIATGIVEAHGGRIGVESTQGRGSTFWFTVPRA